MLTDIQKTRVNLNHHFSCLFILVIIMTYYYYAVLNIKERIKEK